MGLHSLYCLSLLPDVYIFSPMSAIIAEMPAAAAVFAAVDVNYYALGTPLLLGSVVITADVELGQRLIIAPPPPPSLRALVWDIRRYLRQTWTVISPKAESIFVCCHLLPPPLLHTQKTPLASHAPCSSAFSAGGMQLSRASSFDNAPALRPLFSVFFQKS
jgi:hypothetical protein